jgi:hypothetical protein
MKNLILFLALCFLIPTSCKKKNDLMESGGKIEFYLLKSYTKDPAGYAISNNSIVLSDSALIKYEDIIWYDPNSHTFKFSDRTANLLNDFEHNQILRKPFAVAINKKIIYTGYFWAGFFSSSCDWIVMDVLNYDGKNELSVKIGYPGLMSGMNIPDKRNDKELLEILKSDHKLIIHLNLK